MTVRRAYLGPHESSIPMNLARTYGELRRYGIQIGTYLGQLLLFRGSFPLAKVLLILIWMFTLWRGEKRAFFKNTESCDWDKWEDWPADATPHHLVLLADPQLVDPHTYPGRPWPLDQLTVAHTDQYMRRSFEALQESLDPDSIVFLGDLFDGGREWWTNRGAEPEDKTWKKYDSDFWLQEYDRWGKIFLHNNGLAGRKPTGAHHPRGDRKLIASLPGNHDLGISSGVRIDVRNRFAMFFGEPNRVDVIGNHSFVSVDTVSLTAKALESSTEREAAKNIWEPASQFLDGVTKSKALAVERYLKGKQQLPENPRLDHSVLDVHSEEARSSFSHPAKGIDADIPTILLTHVPLFRAAGTPCGPLREKYPPSKPAKGSSGGGDADSEQISDERNALSLHSGYQYQNVLHPEISEELIRKVGNVAHVFSGDDHDYCEVVHRGYTSHSAGGGGGGVREITVKSMSWAMGVRKPGFLLVSLWNPIDDRGESIKDHYSSSPSSPSHHHTGQPTIQTHLCLLPDALGTFIWYGQLFVLTVLALALLTYRSSNTRALPHDRDDVILGEYRPTDKPSGRRAGRKQSRAAVLEFQAALLQVSMIGFAWYLWLARRF